MQRPTPAQISLEMRVPKPDEIFSIVCCIVCCRQTLGFSELRFLEPLDRPGSPRSNQDRFSSRLSTYVTEEAALPEIEFHDRGDEGYEEHQGRRRIRPRICTCVASDRVWRAIADTAYHLPALRPAADDLRADRSRRMAFRTVDKGPVSEPEFRIPNLNNLIWMHWQEVRRDNVWRYR